MGAKVAAQASVRNAIMSKGRFIAVLLFAVSAARFPDRRLIEEHCYQALVSACLRGQGKWLRPMGQIVSWPLTDETSSQHSFRDDERATLQIKQQIAPVVRALASTIGEADQFLAAFRRRADQESGFRAGRDCGAKSLLRSIWPARLNVKV